MGLIKVVPEHLIDIGAEIRRATAQLEAIEARVAGAASRLDWEVRQKAGVDGQISRARGMARELASRGQGIGNFATTKGQAFRAADQQSAGRVATMSAAHQASYKSWALGPGAAYTVPTGTVDQIMRLGRFALPAIPGMAVPLAIVAGLPVAGAIAARVGRGSGDLLKAGDRFLYGIKTGAPGAGAAMDGARVLEHVGGRATDFLFMGKTKAGDLAPYVLDKRFAWVKHMGHGLHYFLPGIGTVVDFVDNAEKWHGRGLGVVAKEFTISAGNTLTQAAIASTGVGAVAIGVNALYQGYNTAGTWSGTGAAMLVHPDATADQRVIDSAHRAQRAIRGTDLTEITRDGVSLAVNLDVSRWQAQQQLAQDFWRQPTVKHAVQLGLLSNSATATPTLLLTDEQVRATTIDNAMKVATGIYKLPGNLIVAQQEIARHQGVVQETIVSGAQQRLSQGARRALDLVKSWGR